MAIFYSKFDGVYVYKRKMDLKRTCVSPEETPFFVQRVVIIRKHNARNC